MVRRILILLLTLSLCLLCACTTDPQTDEQTTGPETTLSDTMSPESSAPLSTKEVPVGNTETEPPSTTERVFSYSIYYSLSADTPFYEYYMILDGDGSYPVWLQECTACIFDDPRDINPLYLFYEGFSDVKTDWSDLSDEGHSFLVESGFDDHHSLQTLPAQMVEAAMQETLGISLSDINGDLPEQWVYLEETDCYYTNHGDTLRQYIEISDVQETEDGLLQIYYHFRSKTGGAVMQGDTFIDAGNSELVITLRPMEDGSYQAVSNQFVPTE